MKSVLVTGGTGFVGRTLVERLRRDAGAEGHILAPASSEVDFVDRDATFRWFERHHWTFDCEHVVHLAALYKAGGWPVAHPATQFHVNLCININVLEAWKRFFPKAKFTSVLSYCMYPPGDDPHHEGELWGTEPEDYLFAYAMTKKAMLVGQRAYRQEFGLDCRSVILPTVYGPGDSFAENSHVMGALIGKFVRAAKNGGSEVEVWGDGSQRREFLYVEDAADGIIAAAKKSTLDVVNLGTGTADSIGHIAETIREAAGFGGRIAYNTDRFVGVRCRLLDVTRANEHLGWRAATSLADGIRNTVRWYRETLKA